MLLSFRMLLLAWLAFPFAIARAEWHDFEGESGQTMKAELVSYRGTKVSLRREDGREFEVEANIFSLDDQIYIKQWMADTPEKIDYNFRVEVAPKRLDTAIDNQPGVRYKTDTFVYEFSLANLSRDVMKNLVFRWRIIYEEEVSETYGVSTPSNEILEGEYELEEAMPYNKELVFSTEPIEIQSADYGSYDYDDELRGCLLRVLDANGRVALDWVMPISTMKGYTWENTGPGDSPRSNG